MPIKPADASALWHHIIKSPKGRLLDDNMVRKDGSQLKMHKKLDRLIPLQLRRISRAKEDLVRLNNELQDYYSSGNFTEKRHKAYLNRLAEMEKRLDKIANHEIYLIPMETTPTKKRSGKRLHDLKGLDLVVSGNRELLKARQARAAK